MVEQKKFKSGDLLLILLYSSGVKEDLNEQIMGRTRLLKLLFLFDKECYKTFYKENPLIDEDGLPKFFAWNFGPMSKDVLEDLEFFIKIKFVEQVEIENSFDFEEAAEMTSLSKDYSMDDDVEQEYVSNKYYLTPIGKKYVEKKLWGKLTDKQVELLKELKARINKASLNSILEYVYRKYPKYTERSLIKEEILGH